MMQWTYARIDRVESGLVHCVFCNRALRSGRLIVLRDESGGEAYAGPACAKKHVGAPTEPILDLSKMAMLLVVKLDEPDEPDEQGGDSPSGKKSSSRGVKTQSLERDDVVHYLRLRVEHMPGFSGNATQRLREYHSQLQNPGQLGENERIYVERLMGKSKAANSIYSLRNVERCIGAAYWLRIAIEQTKQDRREFLEKMLRSLCENWRLSTKQIDAINRWGEGVRRSVSNYPVLDVAVFEGVQAPRFAGGQNSVS